MSTDVRGSAKGPDDLSSGDRADLGLTSLRGPDRLGPINDAKGQSMSIKLTDTQFIMLNAAAQREDRCLVASSTLKGAAALKLANKLISAGFVEEIDRRRIGNHENQRFRVLLRGLAERAEKTGFPFE